MRTRFWLLAAALACAGAAPAQSTGGEEWIQLFNGRDLTGWLPKIAGHALNDNFRNTFRVEDGILVVSYDGYTNFDSRFGHLFYKEKFSH
jgi:hypothetical protein